jgi:3-deoxy-7-phosphoheptulonate synthase
MRTDNLRITRTRPLIAPAVLEEEIPLTEETAATVASTRQTVEAILEGRDERLLLVVGPCSIHDPEAAREYAGRLRELADEVSSALFVVMRVYF